MKKILKLWKRKFSDLQMRSKIIASIYLILLPIFMISTGVIFYWNWKNIEEDTIQLYQRFVRTACDNIDYLQQDVLDISDYFAVNSNVHSILAGDSGKYLDNRLFWTKNTSISLVSDMLAIKSQIKTVILYPENGLEPYYISRDSSVHNTDISYVRELGIYDDIIQAKGDILWRRVDEGKKDIYLNNKSDKMVAYRMLFDLAKKRRLGVLAIGIEVQRYEDILENMLQKENEGAVILDNQGKVLISRGEIPEEIWGYLNESGEGLSQAADSFGRIQRENCGYIFYGQNSKKNLQVCYISPKVNWGILKGGGITLPAVMFLILLVAAWPLSAIISGNLSKSTNTLLKSMEKFQRGDFSERVPVEGGDEIGRLSRGFNKMAADTQTLIQKNYVMALKEREIELNALQSQINPHFLYNVLDSLYWEAIDAGSEKMSEDILALSELFRLLLSQGESEIEVHKEIELINRYLQIQRMRFSRRFSYQIDVEEGIMHYKISKLLLQPFVENAIVHGFERKQETGYVKIQGREYNGNLWFVVEDDGAGMDQEMIDRLLQEDDSSGMTNQRIGSYAIRNIKERLSLRYGTDYTLEIKSQKDKGTMVTIIIPITH